MPRNRKPKRSETDSPQNAAVPQRGSPAHHHNVYVVYLRNPKGDGKAGYYVGMTGLSPEQRFQNHKSGIKAARVVRKHGERLVPRLYAHLNPMPYAKAKEMEGLLAESLRKRGFLVYGGH
jgi:predicted GIY-YIG superfamily endonuclease